MFMKGLLYAPEGADTQEAPAASAPATDNYADNFGGDKPDKLYELDKIKPSYEPISFEDEPATPAEPTPTEEAPAEKAEEVVGEAPAHFDANDYTKLKAEYEEYKKAEEERFNKYYANLEAQRTEKEKLSKSVDALFMDENFVSAIDNAEDGKAVAKTIMAKTVEIADSMVKQALAPVYEVVKHYQNEQVKAQTDKIFSEFKTKYGEEAERCMTPGTPENKALVAELKQNPNLPLEKAFLLARPSFVGKQVNQKVKETIDHKRSMALSPSTGKSMAPDPAPKINTIDDAIMSALKEIRKK